MPSVSTVSTSGQLDLDVLRRAVGFVPQETFLFGETLRENVLLGAPDDGRLERVAEVSQLAEALPSLPNGFDTMLGERGINLSGGQKQRTAIARALAQDPPVFVLDDALSAVDAHTEAKILAALRGALSGRTSLIVSHRLAAVRDADWIVVIDEGRIVEEGVHGDLIARGGRYWELLRRQQLEEELEEESVGGALGPGRWWSARPASRGRTRRDGSVRRVRPIPPTGPASPEACTTRPMPSGVTPPATRATWSSCFHVSTARSSRARVGPTCAPTKARRRCAKRSRHSSAGSRSNRFAGPRASPPPRPTTCATRAPTGAMEHRGLDGSSPAGRANRHGRWLGAMAENIAYGDNPAREVVVQLLVDDGVADRGHRDNLLDPRWGAGGVACGPHKEYGQMCVMDYAAGYRER